MYQIEVCNRQDSLAIDPQRLEQAIAAVLEGERIGRAEISLAVVTDGEIHELNRRFLAHDEATDVLSFPLDQRDDWLEGEIVVSADTAVDRSAEFRWSAAEELILYVIHGTLHLVGYRDKAAEDRARMRQQERHYLTRMGICPVDDVDGCPTGLDGDSENEAEGESLA